MLLKTFINSEGGHKNPKPIPRVISKKPIEHQTNAEGLPYLAEENSSITEEESTEL